MRNNNVSKLQTSPNIDLSTIKQSNKSVLVPFGLNMAYYMRLNGLSDKKLANRVGCSESMILQLRRGQVEICGFSLLSRISLSMGFSLGDWLVVKQPNGSVSPFGAAP